MQAGQGGARLRLSDYLNAYDGQFLCLTDVQIADRGQAWRVADTREFLAVAVASITYVTPLRDRLSPAGRRAV